MGKYLDKILRHFLPYRELRAEHSGHLLTRLDRRPIKIRPTEVLGFSCVRNELLRLPYFLKYHREMGVDRFFFVDNDSTDSTVDHLLSQTDVHVFHTDASYAESKCGVDWLNVLLKHFGTGHWTMTLDADELFVYPMCEKVPLRKLLEYLEQSGAQAVMTFLLDMYSEKPIKDSVYTSGEPFLSTCEYFDSDSYHVRGKNGVPVRGGPRHRLFWEGKNREKPSPVLRKIPMVKWREDLSYEASTHVIPNVKHAELTGVLQHFKFFSDFHSYAEKETERKEHWDNAAQYGTYWDVLQEDREITAYYHASKRYSGSRQLVKKGLMQLPEDYLDFVKTYL